MLLPHAGPLDELRRLDIEPLTESWLGVPPLEPEGHNSLGTRATAMGELVAEPCSRLAMDGKDRAPPRLAWEELCRNTRSSCRPPAPEGEVPEGGVFGLPGYWDAARLTLGLVFRGSNAAPCSRGEGIFSGGRRRRREC